MSDILIVMKDGRRLEFKHQGRAGGSYTKTLKLEHGWATVEDEWYHKTSFPASEIAEIQERPSR